MLKILITIFFWISVTADVKSKLSYVKIQSPYDIGGLLPSKPFETVAIDFTLLEKDNRGFENDLVVTDVFSTITISAPTKGQKASAVARVFLEK